MKSYAIYWKSNVSGRIGTGTGLFEQEEAERLATELNLTYPDINHEAIIPLPPSAERADVPAEQPVTETLNVTDPQVFTDPQVQRCFERSLAEADGSSDEQCEVAALLVTHDWFQMLEGSHSGRVHETIERLLAPRLRAELHRWCQRSEVELDVAQVEFRSRLSQLAGESFTGSTNL